LGNCTLPGQHLSDFYGKKVIYNVIGPPGSGKTTYIRKHFGFAPPVKEIDRDIFEDFIERKIFEHTGLNPQINKYLSETSEKICTVWFKTGIWVCLGRILKDWWHKKTTIKQTWGRLKILSYYTRNSSLIYLATDRKENELVII
jgi:predicted kinase